MSGERSRILGRWGEAQAAAYLRQNGYQILEAGWRCRFGELDLIAAGRGMLCFVEVKLRKSDAFGCGAAYVDRRKQSRLRTTAELYLQEHPTQLQPRFDVIEILAPGGTQTRVPKIRHLENCF